MQHHAIMRNMRSETAKKYPRLISKLLDQLLLAWTIYLLFAVIRHNSIQVDLDSIVVKLINQIYYVYENQWDQNILK